MSKLKIVIFIGSTRDGRLADRVLKFVRNFIGSEHDVTVYGEYIIALHIYYIFLKPP